MRILILGHGAREHAIAKRLAQSDHHPEMYTFMGSVNAGLARLCRDFRLGSLSDVGEIVSYAREERIDLVIPGQELPLIAGVVDALQLAGIPVIGPTRGLARLEGDKSYLRALMSHCAPEAMPRYRLCTSEMELRAAADELDAVAIKPLGLTGGKGVKVTQRSLRDDDEALGYALEVIHHDGRVLVEECLQGEEFSLMAFSDGARLVSMPLVQDFKLAYEGDSGPMTGGMGAYSCADHLLPLVVETERVAAADVLWRIVAAAQEENGALYRGFIYGQFMLTADGPKVIEINARLGDPEAMNVMHLLNGDLVDISHQMLTRLEGTIPFSPIATVVKYLVPKGYPSSPEVDRRISVDETTIAERGGELFYASVRLDGQAVYTTGSRALAVLCTADTVAEAAALVEGIVQDIEPEHLYHRSDIASASMLAEKVAHMEWLRSS